jgi:predicted DsbA family dithiol-disulfide isomerase
MEEEFNLDVTWWPFELHPETPVEGRHVDELIAPSRRSDDYRSMLKQFAADAGLTFASNRWVANSHRALELAEFARERMKFDEVHEALFRAYFGEARNIGDIDVLLGIATECGLDENEFAVEVLAGGYADVVDRATQAAREGGFTSTPTMIFGDKVMIPGAQDMTVYRDVLRRLGAEPRNEAPGI